VVNFTIVLSLLIVLNFIHNLVLYLQHRDSLLASKLTVSKKLLIMAAFRKKHIICPVSRGPFWSPLIDSVENCSALRTDHILISGEPTDNGIYENTDSVVHSAESWTPLRIPLVLVLTVSLVISLALGDLSSYFVA
jgi:hypothetical protein